ncbi:MAG: TetR/AcrR family transcriptional regulator [Clostridia bacterium]|nr:TetR/AcrR family transcriptional regulator [Clostridia bacterium]
MRLGKTEEKRDSILQAAAKVFSKKGFYQARIEDISREAGVGKGTVYEYFSSKEALFKNMLVDLNREHFETVYEGCPPMGSVVRRLEKILVLHFKFIENQRDVGRLLIESHFSLGKEIHLWLWELQLEKIKDLAKIIDAGAAQGEFRRDVDVYLAAHIVFGAVAAVSGMIIMEEIPSGKLENLARNTLALVLRGLKVDT